MRKRISSFGAKKRVLGLFSIASLLLAVLAGCGSTGSQSASANEATPTPLPTPIVPEKPIYTVQTGTVVQTLEFTGRASPVLEQELFFETSGNVGDVSVARGDWVQAGDVLAELDIDDLQKQLAQKQVNLETLQLKQEQAQLEASEAITTTLTKVEQSREDLASAKTSSANDLAAARASVASAETSLVNAKLNLTIVQSSDTVAKNVRDREYEANWYEVNYGEYLKKFQAGQIDEERLNLEYNNLLTARDNLEKARAQAELALSQAEAQVSQAQESLRQARAKLAELQGQPAVADAQAALETQSSALLEGGDLLVAASDGSADPTAEAAIARLQEEINTLQAELAGERMARQDLDDAMAVAQESYLTLVRKAAETEILSQLTGVEVQLAAVAQPPANPATPGVLISAVVGGLGGAVVGLGLAFLWELWPREDEAPER